MAGARPDDVLRLGPQVAAIKASMPAKRWKKFVKVAHARGHTVGSELSDTPNALKERTAESLREEARKSVATAYAPAQKELSQREAAIGYLKTKRDTDNASYRTWLSGEVEKLNAQAKAADATLATQQSTIATETKTAIEAARADSLKRLQDQPGALNPSGVDTSAADAATTAHIGAAREQTAAITKIGEDARTLATAAVQGQQAAREAAMQGDTWKALADAASDRLKLKTEMGGATLDRTSDLIARNADLVKSNREADLAAASLGLKEKDLSQQIKEANRKYKLETAKQSLAEWKAQNADEVARAKVKLGYDEISSREGVASARRKLDKELAKIRAADKKSDKDKPKGVSKDERDLYQNITHVQGILTRWDQNNAVPIEQRDRNLLDQGFDTETIAIARALARNNGILPEAMRARVRKLGVVHSGYFWAPLSGAAQPVPSGGNLGR